MGTHKNNLRGLYLYSGIILLIFSIYYPLTMRNIWFSIIYKIKDAILLGDSGYLILGSALMSFLYAVKNSMMFLGIIIIIYYLKTEKSFKNKKLISAFIVLIYYIISMILVDFPQEIITTSASLIICLFMYDKLFNETSSFFIIFIMSFQVFFAFEWLNIMPALSIYNLGQSDIPYSIKTASIYLNSQAVLNFSGFAFFLSLFLLAFSTAMLYNSYSKNMKIMKDNYEKQKELQEMKSKVLQNRINNEMKTLVHDLKTPLVTIRGLSSLLSISKDERKIKEYCERIEGSVDKMNEMISCFLYENSRQSIKVEELIDYVRAQIPLEDNSIKIDIIVSDSLPNLYVNKIRMARAIMNILENAIIVPCKQDHKHIILEVKNCDFGISIMVKDNGVGINNEEISKIFEIGYSTNKTSGLGLWFVKKVIEENEGKIDIISKKDEGTTVIIYLPSA
ncbi:ATP-binding protein [Caloramator sp. E03]|uniref:ATP-binding protein n=1 Tax=Caloramator sp. E03 TaxID=2576307 RepID=UPI00143CE57E|nr:ATP-binding protein [Caloramator sp. E03]